MFLFYFIHFLILLEVILAILLIICIQEKIQWCKTKKEQLKDFEKIKEKKLQEMKDFLVGVNKKIQFKPENKVSRRLFEKVLKSLLMDFVLQNVTVLKIGKKIRFLKVVFLGFLLAFSYLETKKV